jgi:hypothetical protein
VPLRLSSHDSRSRCIWPVCMISVGPLATAPLRTALLPNLSCPTQSSPWKPARRSRGCMIACRYSTESSSALLLSCLSHSVIGHSGYRREDQHVARPGNFAFVCQQSTVVLTLANIGAFLRESRGKLPAASAEGIQSSPLCCHSVYFSDASIGSGLHGGQAGVCWQCLAYWARVRQASC